MLDILNRVTAVHEAGRLALWAVGDAPSLFIDMLMRASVGIEIPIDRLLGKLKASQDETVQDRPGTVGGCRKRLATSPGQWPIWS